MASTPKPSDGRDTELPAEWTDTARLKDLSQLPLHALFPREVRLEPRERLLIAMADSVREHGFRGASIADVVKRARTSRRTFYECFADREDCFLSLFDVSNTVFVARITAALDTTKPWREQIDAALAMYLQVVRSEPAITLAFSHELSALGERGAERKRREMDSFAALLVDLVERVRLTNPELRPMPQSAAYVITSGLRESAAHALATGRDPDEIAAAVAEMISSIVSD